VGTFAKVAIVVALFGGAFLGSQALYQASRPLTEKELEAALERQVEQVKPTLPQDVHPMVTWFDVEARGDTIVYKYRVHTTRSALLSKRKELREQMQGSFTSWAVSMMLPRGAKAEAALYDDNGTYAYTVDVVE
jgi:hypothetical protein